MKHCYNMAEPWKHMLNERSQTQRPHVIWFHLYDLYEMSWIGKFIGQKADEWLPGAGGRGKWGETANGSGFLLEMMKIFWN